MEKLPFIISVPTYSYNHLRLQVAFALSFFSLCPVRLTLKIKHRSKAARLSFSALWKGEHILPANPQSCSEVPGVEQCICQDTQGYSPGLGPEGHQGKMVPSTDHRTAPTHTI